MASVYWFEAGERQASWQAGNRRRQCDIWAWLPFVQHHLCILCTQCIYTDGCYTELTYVGVRHTTGVHDSLLFCRIYTVYSSSSVFPWSRW